MENFLRYTRGLRVFGVKDLSEQANLEAVGSEIEQSENWMSMDSRRERLESKVSVSTLRSIPNIEGSIL